MKSGCKRGRGARCRVVWSSGGGGGGATAAAAGRRNSSSSPHLLIHELILVPIERWLVEEQAHDAILVLGRKDELAVVELDLIGHTHARGEAALRVKVLDDRARLPLAAVALDSSSHREAQRHCLGI